MLKVGLTVLVIRVFQKLVTSQRPYWLFATQPEWLNYGSIIMNYLREKRQYITKGVFRSLFQL